MSARGDSQKRLKKPPACDSCKARRVLCHPQPDNAPCPRCVEKNTICTTTPIARGRPKKAVKPTASTSFVGPRGSSLAVASLEFHPIMAVDLSVDCPPLDPEFVAHCFQCFEFMPHVSHPLIRSTGIKDAVAAASCRLELLPPQSRVLTLCILAVTSLASYHESVIGPGPAPQSLADHAFFSAPDLRPYGLRRAAAYRALRAKAVKAAWEIGIMLEPTDENAVSCYFLDLLEQSDSVGPSRPWAGSYILHVRALAPGWRAGKYTQSDEARWMGFLMSEALFATARRMPILVTHHDQNLLSGPEPPPLDDMLQSLETFKKPGLQVVWSSMNAYAFHVVCLARQLSETINGDFARLSSLSEAAVIKFLSGLGLLQGVSSLLLGRVDAAVGPAPYNRAPIRYEDGTADSMARACAYGLVMGFITLVLPFYRELELRGDEGEPRTRERMRLFRMQARDMAVLGVRELASALRYLPRVHYMPLNWRTIYPWAEFCAECVPENMEDLETIASELKLMGYSLDILSAPQAVELINKLDAYVEKSMTPPEQAFFDSAELAELFMPLQQQQPWMGDDGMILDATQNPTGFDFPDVSG
ncbi:hypothetical protein B0H19DRAFT_1143874 [Mycena capillaripes]|nr:hypothetical protein B0H19DRAFT_1143874 [Mycena capillaripes]